MKGESLVRRISFAAAQRSQKRPGSGVAHHRMVTRASITMLSKLSSAEIERACIDLLQLSLTGWKPRGAVLRLIVRKMAQLSGNEAIARRHRETWMLAHPSDVYPGDREAA